MSSPKSSLVHAEAARRYIDDVLSGRILACKYVKQACQRHLDDLERSKSGECKFRFDEEKGDRVCRFISLLPHVKGKWAKRDPKTGERPRIKLEDWQCFVLLMIYGWVKKANGMRRFNKASIYVPRKNSKSTTAAGIGWWMFAKDDEEGAEVYCGATSEKQALEVFSPARAMAIRIPSLASGTSTTVNTMSLVRESANAKFVPVVGKPGDGASPHLAIVDEYHEHPDSSLYDTMVTGMGAREQPLALVISTAGDNLAGPCKNDWDDVVKILGGTIEDDTHFGIIYTIDEGDNWATEEALKKANPNWGISVNPEIYLPSLHAAIRDPKKQAVFKTKHLNMWVNASNGWINMESWNACRFEILIKNYIKRKLYLGLDAGSKIDMTSLAGIFDEEETKGFSIIAKHFLPEETVRLPQNRHYQGWVASGQLIATPGGRVDFTFIEDAIREWSEMFNVQCLAYDPKELNDFINRVGLWASFDRIEVTQGATLMSEPMKELEAQIEARTFRHGGDPVLTWMMSNVIRKEARGGGPVKYYYPTKAKPENKIDGVVAAIMALSRAMAARSEWKKKSVYETRGPLSF